MSFNIDLKKWGNLIATPENETYEQYCRRTVDTPTLTTDYQPDNPQWVANRKRIMDQYEEQVKACIRSRAGGNKFFRPQNNTMSLQPLKKVSFSHPLLRYGLLKK